MDKKNETKKSAKKLQLTKESLKSMTVKTAIKAGVSAYGWCTYGCVPGVGG